MKVAKVDNTLLPTYLNLALAYEAEFSGLTEKKPNKDGSFELDTHIEGNVIGYIAFNDEVPAGMAAIAYKEDGLYEVCEFYIVPCFRRKYLGKIFIGNILDRHRGSWEVKQIDGANYATSFWRAVISDYTNNQYSEDVFDDSFWGKVTRQKFTNIA